MKISTLFVALSLLLCGCRGWDTEERPIHLIKNMDTQEKAKAGRRDFIGACFKPH